MSAAGNDFVLLDASDAARTRVRAPELARRLCSRRAGVGADGLLLVGRAGGRPVVSYLNSDGSRAFCGNGARSAALWLHLNGAMRGRKAFSFDSDAGPLQARIGRDGRVSVLMPAPARLRLGRRVRLPGRTFTAHTVDTGAPHAVIEVRGLGRFPVVETGRALRRHPAFGPKGTNVDFISVASGTVTMRTYERGVEDETLACGTGAVAAAVVARALGRTSPTVWVRVRGGDTFKVDLGTRAGSVWLEGPSRIVFTGEVPL